MKQSSLALMYFWPDSRSTKISFCILGGCKGQKAKVQVSRRLD